MGAFGWLKRALFGAESLAKSGIEKGKEAGAEALEVSREKLGNIQDELSESVEAAKDKFENLFDDVSDSAGSAISKAKESASDAAKSINLDKAKETGQKIMEKGGEYASKAGEKLEAATEDIVEASDKAWEKIADVSSNLYDKAKAKAEDIGEKIGDKVDDMMEKAEAMEAEDAAYDAKHPTGIYEGESHNEKLEGSLLDDTDDFFAKAAAFADGDYEKASEGKMTIEEAPSSTPVEDDRTTAGFTDLDGDGDEITDDAIIVEDDKPEDE